MSESKPKKSLGQHWLHDIDALQAMVAAADVKAGDVVLEIGPGLGTLTVELLGKGARVIAVEYDHDLAINLTKNIQQHISTVSETRSWKDELEVVESDILSFDFTSLPKLDSRKIPAAPDSPEEPISSVSAVKVAMATSPSDNESSLISSEDPGDSEVLRKPSKGYKVVANIPYYLTSNLIRRMCESANPFSMAALLVQKEVAERVCASAGQTSLLSISTQFYCKVGLGPVVLAELFTPPPKVDSQILMLEYRDQPLFKEVDTVKFFMLVKAGFSERRKKLRSSLSGGLQIDKNESDALLSKAGISVDLRAQNLSLEQWYELYKCWV